jgi:hypothetical protein
MAQKRRSAWSIWVRRSSGVAVLVFLASCQLAVPSALEVITCAPDGAVGPPNCPEGQVCWNGQCNPCQIGYCPAQPPAGGTDAGASGEGGAGEGGDAGAAGSGVIEGGRGGEAGVFGGSGGDAGQSGEAGNSGTGGGTGGGAAGDGGVGGAAGTGGSAGDAAGGGSGGDAGAVSAGTAGSAGDGGSAGSGGAPVPPGKLGEVCGDGDSCEMGLSCKALADWGKSGGKVCTRPC